MFLQLCERIAEAMGKGEELAEVYSFSQTLHPNPVYVALLAKLEQYYIMARHKNNYKRRWEAKRSGREIEPVQVPQGFGAGRKPAPATKTLTGYGDAQVVAGMGDFTPSAELQSDVDRIMKEWEGMNE